LHVVTSIPTSFAMDSIENEWESFFQNSASDDGECIAPSLMPQDFVPHCTDIKISTKTKILYLNQPLDLNKLFWDINVIPYDSHTCGVTKKQMKFNFTDKSEVRIFEEKITKERNANVTILNQIDNPNGRVTFKDVRKVNIGFSKSDIAKSKKSSKSAFYNCLVIIYRTFYKNKYKEIHIKIFNSGKLEIPGIQEESFIDHVIEVVKSLIDPLISTPLVENVAKRETVLVNSNFSCNYFINRNELFQLLKHKYNIKCNYDSCSYPGIQCKYKLDGNEISFMIFRTGSVLIVGKCEDEVLFKIYEFLKEILISEVSIIFEPCYQEHKKNKKKVKKTITLYHKYNK
jgi:TATA-box binding protein (TBP) (component of TFIID and TFIIIB)